MTYDPTNPLIVQSDGSVLLEVDNPKYEETRDRLSRFAELEKSPEHIHTYRISPLSLWNAAAAGLDADLIIATLTEFGKFEVPQNIRANVTDGIGRYGQIKLLRSDGGGYVLYADDPLLITEVSTARSLQPYLRGSGDRHTLPIDPRSRGHVKQALIKIGFPVEDLAGYVTGDPLPIFLRSAALSGCSFRLRPYQQEAADIYYADGRPEGGSGVIVLPCGAGKTIVGMGAMARLQTKTLILSTNIVAVHQWRDELLDKTSLREDDIGEYTGEVKEIKPVTIATYQIMTHRRRKTDDFPHFDLFTTQPWGLIIYDEVHLLPAPVFRIVAEIQATRRLGLTATLVREDGKEDDVFSLIGPKRYDVPWRELEKQGWIAAAECTEIRVPLPRRARMRYAVADQREKFRIASENPLKLPVATRLLARHQNDQVLIIGQYLRQLDLFADELDLPIITGKTKTAEREELYARFRSGDLKVLVVSKVANFAIDLPDANVAIQISGTFGSRQEEAQRLGRILRPKPDGSSATFYSLVTKDTRDQDFAINRQRFLTEQGYKYYVIGADDLLTDADIETGEARAAQWLNADEEDEDDAVPSDDAETGLMDHE